MARGGFASTNWSDRIVELVGRGFGTGWSPKAPGTVGTLVGVALYWFLADLSLTAYLLATLLLAGIGIWICGRTSRLIGVDDHPGIVFDEIVGYLVTMIAAPKGWQWVVLGFVLFRIFDIAKPWPVRLADRRVHGGFGIMLDDVLAGIYALACLHATHLVVSLQGTT